MALRYLKSGLAAGGFLTLLAVPSFAADTIDASYSVELGGTRVMKANYSTTLDGSSYSAKLRAKTVGVSKLFSKIELALSAEGNLNDDALTPANYNYVRKKNDKLKERSLSFSSNGALKTGGTDYGDDILAALTNKVMDPLSMLLKLSRNDNPCNGKHRAFDGRDVFDVTLSGGKPGADRMTCKIVYKPIAGGDVEDGDTDAVDYTITLVSMTGPLRYFPIEITGYSKRVPFTVSATGINVNGNPLAY